MKILAIHVREGERLFQTVEKSNFLFKLADVLVGKEFIIIDYYYYTVIL